MLVSEHAGVAPSWVQGGGWNRRVNVQSPAVDLQVGREEVAKGDPAGAKADGVSGAPSADLQTSNPDISY